MKFTLQDSEVLIPNVWPYIACDFLCEGRFAGWLSRVGNGCRINKPLEVFRKHTSYSGGVAQYASGSRLVLASRCCLGVSSPFVQRLPIASSSPVAL